MVKMMPSLDSLHSIDTWNNDKIIGEVFPFHPLKTIKCHFFSCTSEGLYQYIPAWYVIFFFLFILFPYCVDIFSILTCIQIYILFTKYLKYIPWKSTSFIFFFPSNFPKSLPISFLLGSRDLFRSSK